MFFNTIPHEEAMQYMNNQQWQGNFSYPSFQSNLTYNSLLGWRSYQNQDAWRPQVSPLYEQKSKLDVTLEKFISVCNQNQCGWKYQPPALPESTVKLEKTLEKFLQASLTYQKNMDASRLRFEREQLAKQNSELSSCTFSGNTQTNPKEKCNAITTRSDEVIKEGVGDNLKVEGEVSERKEKEGEKEESEKSEEEKELGVENSESFVNKEKMKIEQERKEREEADLRARIEVYRRKDLPYPPVPKKRSEDQSCEEVCGKPISAPMPTLHTDVKSQEVKTTEKVPTLHTDVKSQEVKTNKKMCLKVFPPQFDDGKPKVKMCDVTEDEVSTLFVDRPKPPGTNGENSLKRHFGGRLKLEGRRYSSLACLKPP